MSILSLGQIAANQSSLYKLNQKANTAASDVSKAADANTPEADTTEQSSASAAVQRSQAKITNFREAAQGVAKSIAQVAFALRSTEAMSTQLADLQALAKKALNEPVDEKSLEKLNKAVKAARTNIDSIAQKNQLPKIQESTTSEEVLPELSADVLLGKEDTLSSEADIRKFLSTAQHAFSQVSSLHEDVQLAMASYESMATNFEVSMQNQLASTSVLPDQTGSVLDALFGNTNKSLAAQGNHFSSQLLNLI